MKDEFSDFTPLFYRIFRKKWEIGVKIAYGNFGYYPQFTSFFLKFTDQMENWGEDGIWELTVLATCGPNSQNLPRNSRIH